MSSNRVSRAACMWVMTLAVLACGLSGCQEEEGGKKVPASLGEMIAQERDRATSDFERAVFDEAIKTGAITQAQYEEAFALFNRCMSDEGFTMKYDKYTNGLYKDLGPEGFTDPGFDDDAFQGAISKCPIGTTVLVESTYKQQLLNPGMVQDNRTLGVGCLIDGGFVGKNYSVDDLEGDFSGGFANKQPFDPTDPAAELCLLKGGYVFVGGD